jgi:hypothetical protein
MLDINLFFLSDEVWFHLSAYVNSQNSRYWSTENPHQFVETPLHAQKLGVWCAVSTRWIITVFFHLTINSNRYVEEMFNPFVNQLTDEETTYGYFQQYGATAHTALHSMNRIWEVFPEERVVSRGRWSARSPDLTVCDFFLWGALKGKE